MKKLSTSLRPCVNKAWSKLSKTQIGVFNFWKASKKQFSQFKSPYVWTLDVASRVIPHPDKLPDGEDAHFESETVIGVADGIFLRLKLTLQESVGMQISVLMLGYSLKH